MLRKKDNKIMGRSNIGWLKSIFHFSFAEYRNPANMNFGVLRVLNDDLIKAGKGFNLHPHRDMEIISYVVDGQLDHGDNLGNENTLTRGHVQYMSAGIGVYHSEHNYGEDTGRFLQIWIMPREKGLQPKYGDFKFDWNERKNKWFHFASDIDGNAPIKINQDVNIYALELEKDEEIDFEVKKDRQAYLVQIEGNSTINDVLLKERDALEIIEENINIKANKLSHFLVIEMKKE